MRAQRLPAEPAWAPNPAPPDDWNGEDQDDGCGWADVGPRCARAGGIAATYCRAGDLDAWTAAAEILLEKRAEMTLAWTTRRIEALAHSQRFSLDAHLRGILAVYRDVAPTAFEEPLVPALA